MGDGAGQLLLRLLDAWLRLGAGWRLSICLLLTMTPRGAQQQGPCAPGSPRAPCFPAAAHVVHAAIRDAPALRARQRHSGGAHAQSVGAATRRPVPCGRGARSGRWLGGRGVGACMAARSRLGAGRKAPCPHAAPTGHSPTPRRCARRWACTRWHRLRRGGGATTWMPTTSPIRRCW